MARDGRAQWGLGALVALAVLGSTCAIDTTPIAPSTTSGADGDADADGDGDTDADGDADADGDGDSDADTWCADTFSEAAGFVPCFQEADRCGFFAETEGTCDDMCTRFGAECLEAYDNGTDDTCALDNGDACDAPETDELCVCTRPA